MHEINDYIIIGGGVAGLSLSALVEKDKELKGKLLESHSLLGGCASYFNRGGYSFDVGATTLSGLAKNRPLSNFCQQINLELDSIQIDPGIISQFGEIEIAHYKDTDKKVLEFLKLLPDSETQLRNFFSDLSRLEELSYQAINTNQLPYRSYLEMYKMLNLKNRSYIKLLPLLQKNFLAYLEGQLNLESTSKLKILFDELLFITAQNNSEFTPALFGILGANYPADTYYHMGGMQGFIKKLRSKAGPILTNQTVTKIIKERNYFKVITNKDIFYSKKVISTLPTNNNLKLLSRPLKKSETFSAFTLYFTVPMDERRKGIYYQVHTGIMSHSQTKSYFVSFSHPKDNERNKNQRQTVTISTHIMPNKFTNLNSEEYLKIKNEFAKYILDHFCQSFAVDISQIENLEVGTSRTFERFTKRENGSVGGIGHSIEQNLLSKIIQNEIEKDFYEIGDNVFPGQGIAAVIYGSMSLKDFLYR